MVLQGEKRVDGLPALSYMMGKPESVSFMFKNLACVKTGFIFAIELQEGKELMASNAYANAGEKSTTAYILRRMDRYTRNGLILFCDSWFASLNTAKKLAMKVIFFVRMSKQGHSGIPVA
jgi:hypothetical protein